MDLFDLLTKFEKENIMFIKGIKHLAKLKTELALLGITAFIGVAAAV